MHLCKRLSFFGDILCIAVKPRGILRGEKDEYFAPFLQLVRLSAVE